MPSPLVALAAGAARKAAGAAVRGAISGGGGGSAAGLAVNLRVTEASLKQFQKAIDRVALETKKSGKDAVIQAAIRVVRSLQARSKPGRKAGGRGKKLRKIIRNPDYDEGLPLEKDYVGGGAQFLIVAYTQKSKNPNLIPTNNRDDPRRKIKRAGLMKSSWGWMLKDLGRSTSTKHGKRPGVVTVRKDLSGFEPNILLHNRLKYLTLARPNIVNESIVAASRSLEGHLKEKGKRISQSWLR